MSEHRNAGTVYLLHLDPPYRHARHYTGWAKNLDARLAEHAAGRGARLVAVQLDAGGTFRLARTWAGGRNRERSLKRQGGAARHCPICRPQLRAAGATSRLRTLTEVC